MKLTAITFYHHNDFLIQKMIVQSSNFYPFFLDLWSTSALHTSVRTDNTFH